MSGAPVVAQTLPVWVEWGRTVIEVVVLGGGAFLLKTVRDARAEAREDRRLALEQQREVREAARDLRERLRQWDAPRREAYNDVFARAREFSHSLWSLSRDDLMSDLIAAHEAMPLDIAPPEIQQQIPVPRPGPLSALTGAIDRATRAPAGPAVLEPLRSLRGAALNVYHFRAAQMALAERLPGFTYTTQELGQPHQELTEPAELTPQYREALDGYERARRSLEQAVYKEFTAPA